jgi:molybdate transport system substrate-binding protein
MTPMRRLFLTLLLVLPGVGVPGARAEAPAAPLVVFAAASLTDVLGELGGRFHREGGPIVKFSFASSATLARQIEGGAEADVFLPADAEWMDYAATRGLIAPASRANLLGNRLVLVAPADSHLQLKLVPQVTLRAALGDGRLATGDPDSVPVGRYARAALTSLGVWSQVEDRLVRAENVRSALAFVGRGEVPLGIVYATDARADARVRVVDVFPESTHPPITYPVALTAKAAPGAAAFLAFLRSPAAADIFRRYGFTVLAATPGH